MKKITLLNNNLVTQSYLKAHDSVQWESIGDRLGAFSVIYRNQNIYTATQNVYCLHAYIYIHFNFNLTVISYLIMPVWLVMNRQSTYCQILPRVMDKWQLVMEHISPELCVDVTYTYASNIKRQYVQWWHSPTKYPRVLRIIPCQELPPRPIKSTTVSPLFGSTLRICNI